MNKTIIFSAAIAGLIASSAVHAEQGSSAGKTSTVAEGECHGVNACKGKGWVKLSKKECKKQGGKFVAQKM